MPAPRNVPCSSLVFQVLEALEVRTSVDGPLTGSLMVGGTANEGCGGPSRRTTIRPPSFLRASLASLRLSPGKHHRSDVHLAGRWQTSGERCSFVALRFLPRRAAASPGRCRFQ
jgi:hypothetical protein